MESTVTTTALPCKPQANTAEHHRPSHRALLNHAQVSENTSGVLVAQMASSSKVVVASAELGGSVATSPPVTSSNSLHTRRGGGRRGVMQKRNVGVPATLFLILPVSNDVSKGHVP